MIKPLLAEPPRSTSYLHISGITTIKQSGALHPPLPVHPLSPVLLGLLHLQNQVPLLQTLVEDQEGCPGVLGLTTGICHSELTQEQVVYGEEELFQNQKQMTMEDKSQKHIL